MVYANRRLRIGAGHTRETNRVTRGLWLEPQDIRPDLGGGDGAETEVNHTGCESINHAYVLGCPPKVLTQTLR